jgi:hypothetical protein
LFLVFHEGSKGPVEIGFDEVPDQLVIDPDHPEEKRHGEAVQLGSLELQDDLGEDLGGDVRPGPGIGDGEVVPLADQPPDLLEGEVPAVRRVVIAPVGILPDVEVRRGRSIGGAAHGCLP